jgi:WD40 repeat protein
MRVLIAGGKQVIGLAFGPACDAVAATVKGGGVYLWNLTAGRAAPVRMDSSGSDRAKHLSFAPGGRSVTWLGTNGLRTYDRDARSPLTEAGLDAAAEPHDASLTPAGDRLITQHGFPENILIAWRAAGRGWEKEWDISTVPDMVYEPVLAPAGDRVALLTRRVNSPRDMGPFRVQLRSAVSGAVQATSPYSYLYPPEALAFSPDGSRLVAVQKMMLLVWPVPELGEPVRVRNDSRKHFSAAAFHPSGRFLFVSSQDGSVHVFETATWARVARFNWKAGRLRSVAVSPDGTLAAAGGDEGQVILWDLDL